MNDEEIVVKSQMKLLRESLTADMQKVVYSLIDDGSESRIQAEMDKLLADYSETLQAAQQYGISNNHSSDARSVANEYRALMQKTSLPPHMNEAESSWNVADIIRPHHWLPVKPWAQSGWAGIKWWSLCTQRCILTILTFELLVYERYLRLCLLRYFEHIDHGFKQSRFHIILIANLSISLLVNSLVSVKYDRQTPQ